MKQLSMCVRNEERFDTVCGMSISNMTNFYMLFIKIGFIIIL